MKNEMLSRLGRNCVGQAMPDRENTTWKNEIRLITRQAEPDLRVTTTKAFTLIELLVVVLIIGILVAVALPQYQKAVEKARLMPLLSAMKSIAQAQEAYYMANGVYSTDADELDVDMPAGTSLADSIYTLRGGQKIYLGSAGIIYGSISRFQIDWFLQHFSSFAPGGSVLCDVLQTDTLGRKVCENLGGKNKFGDGCGLITGQREACYKYYLPF